MVNKKELNEAPPTMIDPSSPDSGIQRRWTRRQGPPRVGQRTHWNIIRKSTIPEINFGPGYYAHCYLKRSGKLSNAASDLRDIKDSGLKVSAFYTM